MMMDIVGRIEVYLLTTKLIFQKHGTIFVLAGHAQPIVRVGLLDTKVTCDPVALVVHIFGVRGQLGDFRVLLACHTFGLLGDSGQDLRSHVEKLKMQMADYF
jgi:hypothetical protein